MSTALEMLTGKLAARRPARRRIVLTDAEAEEIIKGLGGTVDKPEPPPKQPALSARPVTTVQPPGQPAPAEASEPPKQPPVRQPEEPPAVEEPEEDESEEEEEEETEEEAGAHPHRPAPRSGPRPKRKR